MKKNWKQFVYDNFALEYIDKILQPYDVVIKVSKPRKTKLGDYRPPYRHVKHHTITVNEDLNPFTYIVTLIHEIAHLIIWEQHRGKVKSHGEEWKRMYRELVQPCIDVNVFPSDVAEELSKSAERYKAASHSDEKLARVLKQYDEREEEVCHVEDLKMGDRFYYHNRLFEVKNKMRKRYKCLEISTKKNYLFSPLAEVKLVEN